MHLYNLTLQKSTNITHAVHGNYSGQKQQEIAIARGTLLEIIKPDPNTGKVHTICSRECFSLIRSLISFRLTGGTKDYIVLGSDSGRISILEYNPDKGSLDRVHCETFGKSMARRIVPGQFLAHDPKGRAIMVAACEKQKLVYILNRDAQARLTISSPLEAHKSSTIHFYPVGLDVGFENPVFAVIELDYEDADADPTGEAAQEAKQSLTFYELDLGLNHVVRKYTDPLECAANMLIPVPGGSDGPGGVIVCAENYLIYKNFGDQPDIRFPIPRRRNDLDDPERGMIIVSHATHKTRSMFFFLLQTEQGDLFKVTLETEEDIVTEIRLKYFDTVPVSSSLCVLRTGFLFVAGEFGNHNLYQITRLGEDDDEPEFSSAEPLEEGETFFFTPRGLRNLALTDELDSLSPVLNCEVADLANEDTPQLYVTCGRGPRSTLRVLRHGLEVSEMAVSELPGNPNAVWTVKTSSDADHDSYIIVSFVNATLVLSIGETVEEITDSGFLGTTPTLSSGLMGEDALVQIYPEGIRHIRSDRRVNEWRAPDRKQIVRCACNRQQVVIALTGGEIVYFEMDPTGQLNEYTERREFGSEIIALDVGDVPAGEQRCRFLAVGLSDGTVRIISLDPSDCLQPRTMQALPTVPQDVAITEHKGQYVLQIGLQNGVLLRTTIDSVTGEISDTRTRYLGTKAVKLYKVVTEGENSVLAVSSRSWLSYRHQQRFHLTPLSYEALDSATGFSSEQCPEGIVAIAGNTLRILALEKLGAVFNQVRNPLQLTPRKFVIHPDTANLVIAESDHNAFTEETKKQRKNAIAEETVASAAPEERALAAEMAAAFLKEELPESDFGSPRAGQGMWASKISIISPETGGTLHHVWLEQGQGIHSMCLTKFQSVGMIDWYLLVGTSNSMILNPRQSQGGSLHVYRIHAGERFEYLHTTYTEDAPTAITPFQGRVLIGVGNLLRIYDLGKKKMLRKCELRSIPNRVIKIITAGQRIIAFDQQESAFFIKYRIKENQLTIFADDTFPRWVTAACMLDYSTVVIADKFGSVSVIRLPAETNENTQDDPSGAKALWSRGNLNGASQKAETLNNFFVGDMITSIQKTILIPGGGECVVYATMSGRIGILVPFASNEDADFFQSLEMHMRQEHTFLTGRDHLAFRGYYYPQKSVVDGDLCEAFSLLGQDQQKGIAEEMDRQLAEVSKKLEDIRTRFAF